MCHEMGGRVCLCLDSPYGFPRLVFWLPSMAAMSNFLNHHFWSLLSTDFLCRWRGLSSLSTQNPNFLACKFQRRPVALIFLLQLVQLCANLVPQNITNTQSHSAWSEVPNQIHRANTKVPTWLSSFLETPAFSSSPGHLLSLLQAVSAFILTAFVAFDFHLLFLFCPFFFLSSKYDHKTEI